MTFEVSIGFVMLLILTYILSYKQNELVSIDAAI